MLIVDPKKWDPLSYKVSEELYGATIRRQIKNILKSYTGWYDPLSELIQNALDAVDERKKLGEKDYTPTIWLEINLKDNLICITDNGIGFKEEEFKNFLAPNVSYKKGDTRGNKGVGATYLGYGFNYLQIGTKTSDFAFVGTIKGGREWVEDESNTKIRPAIQQDEPYHEYYNEIDRGSTFVLKFTGDFIRPKDLKWVGADTANQWETVLRIKTPLGGIYFEKKSSIQRCNLAVVDEKGKDGSKLPDNFYKLNGLYRLWDSNDIISNNAGLRISLNEKDVELIKRHNIILYSFFCYSTDVWDKYNDDIVKLRKNTRILRGGIQLATNGMPQGELLMIPLTKNIGFQNVTHAVIHFNSADPDLGRKGFQPELEELAKNIAAATVKAFLNWKKLLKKETGAPPDIESDKEIHEWIREQEDHEKLKPLKIQRTDVFLPTKEASITSEPLNEQDVVALFNQLLAGGVIRGIKIMASNQHLKYDGVCKFCLKKPFENHIFNENTNPLGIKDSISKEFESRPEILEYKYNFDALLEEIEKGDKNERDIKLVIAWEMGDQWKTRYDITPLLHFDNIHHRTFHGETHIVKDSNTRQFVFHTIILKELIDYINDPKKVQEYQKITYMD